MGYCISKEVSCIGTGSSIALCFGYNNMWGMPAVTTSRYDQSKPWRLCFLF